MVVRHGICVKISIGWRHLVVGVCVVSLWLDGMTSRAILRS